MADRPLTLDEVPDDITMPELRRLWAAQEGIKLLRQEQCRRRGRCETWELWRYSPPRPPAKGPRSSWIVITWWRTGWNGSLFLTRAEAQAHMELRGTVPAALVPPLHE